MSQKVKTQRRYDLAFIFKEDIFFESIWITKYIGKFVKQGKKYIVEKHFEKTFSAVKFNFKQTPDMLFMIKLDELKPIFQTVLKRVGRKYHPIPQLTRERRQHIMALDELVKYTKNFDERTLSGRMTGVLLDVFGSKKNYLTKKAVENVSYITEARIYSRLRWM